MFDRSVALLSALYLSVSTFQIYYAQEGRCFSLLVCLLLSAAWCFWEALNGEPRRRWVYWAGVTAFGVLALYAHFIAIFFLAGFGLYVLIRRPRQLLGATISIGAALVLFAPFLVRMLAAAGGGGQVRRYLVLKLPQAYFSFLFGDSLIPLDEEAVQHIPATLKSNWWILALALTSVCILLPFVVRAWSRWSQGISLALTMAFFPVLLAFLVSFKVMLFDERYLIPASPFLYMIVCAGLMEILQASRKGQAAAYAGFAVFAILPVLLSISLANYYFNPRFDKEQWREADLYIDSLVPMDGSGLLVFDPDYIEPCYRYYSKRHLPEWRRPDRSPVSIAQVRAHTDPNQRIVLVRSHADNDSLLTTMREALKENTYREFPRANPIEVYSFVAK